MTIQVSAPVIVQTDTFRSTCSTTVDRGTGNCAILVLATFGGTYAGTTLNSVSIGGVALTAGTPSGASSSANNKFRAFWLADASALADGVQTVTLTASDANARIGFSATVIRDSGGGVLTLSNETITAASTISSATVVGTTVPSAIGNSVVSILRCDFSIASTPISPTTQISSVAGVPFRQELWLTPSNSSSTTSSASGWSGNGVEVDIVSINVATVPVTGVTGAITLDSAVAAGTLTSISSSLTGGITLSDSVASGTLGVQPGVLTITGLKNNTGTLLSGVTLPNVVVIRRNDLTPLLALTSQVINGSGSLVISSAVLVPGAGCQVFAFENDGSLGGCWPGTVV